MRKVIANEFNCTEGGRWVVSQEEETDMTEADAAGARFLRGGSLWPS